MVGMSELLGKSFLRALFHACQQMERRAADSGLQDALNALESATEVLTAGAGEAILSVVGDAFYLGSKMLPHASTEFDAMLRDMKERKIDSVTIVSSATRNDLRDLVALVAGISDDLPAERTVRLNERSLRPSDLEIRPMHGLRRSYAFSLDTLRGVSRDRSLHLGGVMEAVDEFMDGGAVDPGSSLLLSTVQNHDEVTYYHSVNVCLLSMALGRFAGFDRDQIRMLGLGALLHDIGRVIVDEAAMHNPGRLSNEDWAQVRLHPQEGAATIMAASGSGQEIAAVVALEHHVRLDGSGYPDLGGKQPHLFSRIVAIVDSYDAITSFRPYRPARTPNEALRVLLEGAGRKYDADLLRLFIQMTGEYPPGSLVRIEGGQIAMVTEAAEGVRRGLIVRTGTGELLTTPEPIDLLEVPIEAQILPEEAGVEPGSLLESLERDKTSRR
jgi:HD-GYP domain-containing protein (c-di-GMP phosphodiesterase class II)